MLLWVAHNKAIKADAIDSASLAHGFAIAPFMATLALPMN